MKLSIIIPVKNEEEYLPCLLESLKRQTLQPFEIIVSDAGSSDKTVDIAKKFKARIVKGGLPAIGRNSGAKIAKGDFLFFLDADTNVPDDFVEKSIKEIKIRKLKTATVDNVPFYRPNEKGYSSRNIRLFDRMIYAFYNFGQRALNRLGFPIATGVCIISEKKLFEKIKGFDENLEVFEDAEYVKKASRYSRFGVLKSTKIFISTRRFDKKGRFWFPIYMGLGGTVARFLLKTKKNYFK